MVPEDRIFKIIKRRVIFSIIIIIL